MKYFGYFTDNYDCAMRQPLSGEDAAAKVVFDNPIDIFKYALALYNNYSTWAKVVKDYELDEDALKTVDDWRELWENEVDYGFGAPFLYYAEDENGNVIFDSGYLNGGDYDEPDMVLDGEETKFDGNLNIKDIPHKVEKIFYAFDPEGFED